MNIFALICTRNRELNATTKNLTSYLSRANIGVKLAVSSPSIFEGYKQAYESCKADPTDIIIMCHDDIEILLEPKTFVRVLVNEIMKVKTGFVGVAGSRELTDSGVWWDKTQWQRGLLRGSVFHGKALEVSEHTYYGNPGTVAVMDGLFLATQAQTLEKIRFQKPKYFEGAWDFYDIYYTYRAKRLGMKNRVAPIPIRHNSIGELVGRDSWHKNREAFIKKFKDNFPISC